MTNERTNKQHILNDVRGCWSMTIFRHLKRCCGLGNPRVPYDGRGTHLYVGKGTFRKQAKQKVLGSLGT